MVEQAPVADAWRGRVLRAWREYRGVSQRTLADRITVTPAALSNWERGLRSMTHWEDGVPRQNGSRRPLAELVATGLRLSTTERQAFHSLLAAAGAVGTPPRLRWMHNYPPPSGAVWIWLRPAPAITTLSAALWWGDPVQGRLAYEVGDAGVLVQVPVSVPNPPLQLELETAGWVDFGAGWIPDGVAERLGARLADGRELLGGDFPARTPLDDGEEARALTPWFGRLRALADHLGVQWRLVAPHLGLWLSRRPVFALDGATLPVMATAGEVTLDDAQRLVAQLTVGTDQARAWREARGMSRARAAELASSLDPANPVSPRVVELLEVGRRPQVADLISRLDTIYGADGRLGLDRVYDSRGLPAVRRHRPCFPSFWVGPVWIQALADRPGAHGLVQLDWGPWRRRQTVSSGTVLTTRRAAGHDAGLIVSVPDGWHLAAGTGAPPTALDVNRHWHPANFVAAVSLLRAGIADVRTGMQAAPSSDG